MPLSKGSSAATMSKNIGEMVNAGHPQAQAVAAAYREAGKDAGLVTQPNAGIPSGARRPAADGSFNAAEWLTNPSRER